MNRVLCSGLLACVLAACGQPAPPLTPAQAPALAATPATWFICDGINAPTVLVFTGGPPGAVTHLISYTKPTGATEGPAVEYALGPGDGAAGSVYTALQQNGAEIGHVRQFNPSMLETPGAAYTTPYASVKLGDREIACRWLPRTRLMGITGRRSVVISEDKDGDLIYTTYDFTNANARAIDVADGGRTTTFSAEVRGGEEQISPQGAVFRFAKNGYRYVVRTQDDLAQVQVFQGDQLIQTEPFIAVTLGAAAP